MKPTPQIENTRPTAFKQLTILIVMSNTNSAPSIKSKFTEVITESDLIPIPSAEEFLTNIVETALLETAQPVENDSKNLVQRYDETFPEPEIYRTFSEGKLSPWKNTLEFKYFDTMYCDHRSLTDTIRKVRAEAQKLLEVANDLQGRDFILRGEIERHVATVTRTELCQHLLKPMRVRFKSTPVSPFQPLPSMSRSQIT